MRLKDRVALVTGGSSGIGRGICLELAGEGARVIVVDVRETPKQGKYHDIDPMAPTAEVITSNGGSAKYFETDMADSDAVRQLISNSVAHFGGLDILINNAGIHVPGDSQSLEVGDWDLVMGVNLRGPFLSTKWAVPHLKKSMAGRILHIASVHAFAGGGGPVYPLAKAGLVNLTRDSAVELAPFGVTVNSICPGYIETPIQDYQSKEDIEVARQRTPLPRLGLPRDVGRAAVFFASDDAEWITGTALPVDGGWLAPIM
ncbi:MAG: SDR family oxidoreductase [Candidatus Latescibacterota bacterium]|nr:SDR family oxidoreductase [Candidatus Latescibacterota bacterium]